MPFPLPGDLPDPGIEPTAPVSPALGGKFLTTSATWEALEPGSLKINFVAFFNIIIRA